MNEFRALHEAAGAVFGLAREAERPRHYGDPAGEYGAAVGGLAVMDRSFRTRLQVGGRAPVQMLNGVLTGTIPPGPSADEGGVPRGRACYSAILTPKGRMVSDLRVLRLDPGVGGPGSKGRPAGPVVLPTGSGSGERLLLDLPVAGAKAAVEHFARSMPPRFATVEDVSAATGLLTLMGPDAAGVASREVLGLRVEEADLQGLGEGDYLGVDVGDGELLLVVRSGDVATPAFDVLADRATVVTLWRRLLELGASPVGHGVWETLRVEAGRPAFGADMDDGTIPLEAGIGERAIDHGKGCYTGQEVVVRIRDRGHVNRHLRGLRLGDVPTPAAGAPVFAPEIHGERAAGAVTSAVQSPRQGETLALGYVRREVEPGAMVRVGGAEGAEARVVDLDGGAWAP